MCQPRVILAAVAIVVGTAAGAQPAQSSSAPPGGRSPTARADHSVQLGPRPFFLVNDMKDGALKRKLLSCSEGPFSKSDFSIGHRGAALQFPEHTLESYEAGARMGAGILECDVTFTQDLELVCRHAQNDLHITTNILLTPLAEKCSVPFSPAVIGADGSLITPARGECRTSDITLSEFKKLTGKMETAQTGNPRARTPEEFIGGTPNFRTDLYAGPTSGHLMTHRESIELFKELGVKMTPELKMPSVPMPFNGFTQAMYAQKMIDEYKAAGVPPSQVFPQSFNLDDILYWIDREPAYGRRAVYLDDAATVADLPSAADLKGYKTRGINIVAPPTFALLALDSSKNIVPSQYARAARAAGLDIITWTLERSGVLADGNNGFYYQTIDAGITREGDMMKVLDVLARDVGILGIFSDWPATVTYYANCMGLK
jgi:glycerophosphoryl diester phosphodiesterase